MLLVVLSFLLSLSSIQTGLAKFVTNKVNEKFGTTILVESVDLSSFRKIKLKNVLIKDHHQDTLIYVHKLSTSLLSYKNIFDNYLDFEDIELNRGGLTMKTYKGEETNNLTLFAEKFQTDSEESEKTFKLTSPSVYLENISYVLIDENKKETPIVYYNEITGFFDDFEIYGARVSSNIHHLQTKENHNISIVDLQSKFLFSSTKMEFLETELNTKNSKISGDIIFNYKDGDLAYFTDRVEIDADIKKGDIALSDLQKFYDEFGKNDKIHFKTKIKGTLNDLVFKDIDLRSDRGSLLKGTVKLVDIIDNKKFKLDAKIVNLSSNYDHLKNFLPNLLGKNMPSSLDQLGQFSGSGKIIVSRSSVYSKLNISSDMGSAITDIQLSNIDNIDEASYKGAIELIDFDLGKFAGDSLIGKLSLVGEIEGKGFKLENVNTRLTGEVSKHQYKGYTYSNIHINGILKDKHFNGELLVNDPNIQLTFKGLADLSGPSYKFDFKADVAFAEFNKLNLFKRDDLSELKGRIDINVTGSNLDNLVGQINFKEASYTNENEKFYFDDFTIVSSRNDSIREIQINSTEIINGWVKGNFEFKELKKVVKNSLGSLFANYQKEKVTEGQFMEFKFDIHNKIIEVFYPDVKLEPESFISGEINSDSDIFKLTLKSPRIQIFENVIEDIDFQIDNKNALQSTLLSVAVINTKKYNVANVNLINSLSKDTLYINTNFEGGKGLTEKYDFSFYQTINENNQVVVGIRKSEILYKNNIWKINQHNNGQNKLIFDHSFKKFAVDNIDISSGDQHIDIAGLYHEGESKNIDLKFENVNLKDVSPSIDSVAIDGKINGGINLKDVNGQTLPFADLTINYFSINEDFYGDLAFHASSDESITNYVFDATLMNNDLKSFFTRGQVNFTSNNPTIIAEVSFDKFRISAFSPLGKGVISNIRGLATGSTTITGILSNPDIEGEILLIESGLAFPYLNVDYDFTGKTTVKLYEQTFDFQTVEIEDVEKKTKGVLKGKISHKEFKKWYLDLAIESDNLLVLNTKESEEALYYGTGLISGKTTVEGRTDKLVINVDAKTNKGTEFIIPLSDVSTVSESRLIHFISKNEISTDKEKKDEIIFEELKGLSINFNFLVTKDAIAQVVIDKVSGSLLRGSADGNLKLNINPDGQFFMDGSLVIDSGEYQFKNIVNKDFTVKKGGTIVWDGNPFDAELNIEAVNRTKANPAVLLNEVNSSRKIDVDLVTTITGTLAEADFDFDIEIPNASSMVKSELDFKLRKEDDKLTQFFSLLATGAFIDLEQSNSNFNGNAAVTGTIAEQASNVLTQILQSSNDEIQVGVTYDVGTTNSVEDVTTDDQLGVSVSGRIADKVIVSGKVGVPVGSNTSSKVIGEVEINIPLNESETLQAKVYNRQNEIQFDIVDGEGYTQGIGISYRFDFDGPKEFIEKIFFKKTKEEKLIKEQEKDSLQNHNTVSSKKTK